MRVIVLVIAAFILGLTGCEQASQDRKAFEDNAIKSVMESESLMPGTSCKDLIAATIRITQSNGTYIKIQGWQAYKEPGHTLVRFVVDQNEKPLEWRWYIENGEVIPVNDLSQGVMRRQPSKYK